MIPEPGEAMSAMCPSCDGDALSWRVRRVRGLGLGPSVRDIVWSCRQCGAEWAESIQLDDGPRATIDPAARPIPLVDRADPELPLGT